MSPFDIPEILQLILSFLPGLALSKCAQVNSKWRAEVQHLNRKPRSSCLLAHSQDPAEALEAIRSQIKNNVMFIPDVALIFATRYQLLLPSLIECLPARTQVIGCTGRGIIATQPNGDLVEIEEDGSLSVLLLRLPETNVSAFFVDEEEYEYEEESGTEVLHGALEDWEGLVKLPARHPEPTHAIILSQGDPSKMEQFGRLYERGIRVGGISSAFSRGKRALLTRQGLHGHGNALLTFSGPRVKVRATVINSKKVEEALVPLQGERYLAGFLFSCVGRGSSYHGKHGVEAAIFKKLFPNVPLIGYFTGGELGPRDGHHGLAQYGYTSVFCLLSMS